MIVAGHAVTAAPYDVVPRAKGHVMVKVDIGCVQGFSDSLVMALVTVEVNLQRCVRAVRENVLPAPQKIACTDADNFVECSLEGQRVRKRDGDGLPFARLHEIALDG